MQRVPGRATAVGHRLRAEGGARVHLFAAEHVAGLGEVDADLVGPAGLQPAFDDGVVVAEVFDGADVGDRVLGVGVALPAGAAAAQAVAAVSDDPGFNGPRSQTP